MDYLKKSRGVYRASVTRGVNEVEAELQEEQPRKEELSILLEKLDVSVKKVNELDDQIHQGMLNADASDADFTEEQRQCEGYIDKVIRVKSKVNAILYPTPEVPVSPPASTTGSGNGRKRNFKLPKIEMKKFDGEIRNWLSFWAQFEKIHEDETLHESDKFQYLIQAMVSGTLARETVESFPQTAENYPKAVQALKEKFGRETLLVQVYVRELLKLVINNSLSSEKIPLSKMYVKLESHLRALESLKLATTDPSTWLYPLVESSLPEEVLRAWQRSHLSKKDGSKEVPPRSNLHYLMEFLKEEVQGEQQIALASGGFMNQSDSSAKKSEQGQKKKSFQLERLKSGSGDDPIPTAAGLHISAPNSCIFCEKSHPSQECFKARAMSLEEKKNAVKKKSVCFICLKKGHMASKCKGMVKCTGCDGQHYHLFCPESKKNLKLAEVKTVEPSVETKVTASNSTQDKLVLLKTLVVRCFKLKLRVLFDDGSQKSYIRKLPALEKCERLGTHHERNMLFGGVLTDVEERTTFKVPLQSLDGKVYREVPLCDKQAIAGNIPSVPCGPWIRELAEKNVFLTDIDAESEDVDILIGADLMPSLKTGRSIKLKCGLDAVETVFGWTLMGPVPNKIRKSHAYTVTTMHMTEVSCSQLWDLEAIGIQDPAAQKTKLEKEAEVKDHFLNTVSRNEEGRYCVSLPWVGEIQGIPDNKKVAEQRLISTTRKLQKDFKTGDYSKIFQSWKEESFIEEVSDSDLGIKKGSSCHYLPHRAVYKPDSRTTPVRPVFDASCKVGRSPSLNECLEKGPNFIKLIPSIMHRFREGKIGVISDIRKAFQMIEVDPKDQEFLRFLWWEDEDCTKMKTLKHKRVVFGVNCSPLGAVIDYHLTLQRDKHSDIAEKLRKSFYVDNCVTSVSSIQEYQDFRTLATNIMAEAQMELREWECSAQETSGIGSSIGDKCGLDVVSSELISPVETNVLGMRWNTVKDVLRCDKVPEIPSSLTKRNLLSIMQKVFDPMGFLAPALLYPKLTLQEAWAKKIEWDEKLPQATVDKLGPWAEELPYLEKIEVPRSMGNGNFERGDCQLHVFTDASQYAYAAVVYLRVCHDREVSVQMLQSKARVAPMKKLTIPRLELLGCTIGARLSNSVKESFDLQVPTFFWSDSTTALAWIKRNDEWGTFVGNRVKEICSLSSPEDWRHVPGVLNPADLPSRGCTPKELLRSKWWEGPSWLKLQQDRWPVVESEVDEEGIIAEKKRGIAKTQVMSNIKDKRIPWYVTLHSSHTKCLRVWAHLNRIKNKLLKRQFETGELTVAELNAAEQQLFKQVQREIFPQSDVIQGLMVTRDEDGTIKVKTKLSNRDDSEGFRYPLLLPHSHPVVDRMIREVHLIWGHAGVQFLMSKIREKFWILQTRKAIRKIVQQCTRCRRYEAKAPAVPVAALPEDRVKEARVFEVTGIDLAGPLYLKDKTKVWIVLFTCAVYRAIHLELVSSLNSDTFILAMLRFVSRRGRPSVIYSDNGTNFVGANNLFKGLDWIKIQKESSIHRIQWK